MYEVILMGDDEDLREYEDFVISGLSDGNNFVSSEEKERIDYIMREGSDLQREFMDAITSDDSIYDVIRDNIWDRLGRGKLVVDKLKEGKIYGD